MKELGEYLREVRMNNSVEIDEAASDLEIDIIELENIEDGNIKAFKDILSLKDKIREYSKYLGLNPEKIIDEFNDFLFEHTSKINLEDIMEAVKKLENKEKKVSSPYTNIKIRKANWKLIFNFLSVAAFVILLIIFIYFLFRPKEPIINNELRGGGHINEFTNQAYCC